MISGMADPKTGLSQRPQSTLRSNVFVCREVPTNKKVRLEEARVLMENRSLSDSP